MEPIWLHSYPREVSKHITIDSGSTLVHLIEGACRQYQHKIALSCMGVDLTYGQFLRLSSDFASYLKFKLGVKKGDRVAIALPNIIQFPVCFFGILKSGAICTAINPQYTARELRQQLDEISPVAIVVWDKYFQKFGSVCAGLKIDNIILTSISDQLSALRALLQKPKLMGHRVRGYPNLNIVPLKKAMCQGQGMMIETPPIQGDDVALIQFTEGTSGKSKGVMLTQKNLAANVLQIQEWGQSADLESAETVLTALPLYHIFALTVNFLSFFTMGARLILVPMENSIKDVVETFRTYPVTVMTGVNTLYRLLNEDEEFKEIPHVLKTALAGGAPLQPSVNRVFQSITGVRIHEGYGLTEASPVTHCCPINGPDVDGSCGLPLPSTDAKVVDERGTEVALGELGELWVAGPQVMKGYWRHPKRTREVLEGGWLKTGDIARVDDSGYFYIVDRIKDMINVSGFKVFPSDVESVISEHPKVKEVAVIGYDDGKGSEKVKAFIVRKDPSLSIEELEEHCQVRLIPYKRPSKFEFKDELPKSYVGKLYRRMLRK